MRERPGCSPWTKDSAITRFRQKRSLEPGDILSAVDLVGSTCRSRATTRHRSGSTCGNGTTARGRAATRTRATGSNLRHQGRQGLLVIHFGLDISRVIWICCPDSREERGQITLNQGKLFDRGSKPGGCSYVRSQSCQLGQFVHKSRLDTDKTRNQSTGNGGSAGT